MECEARAANARAGVLSREHLRLFILDEHRPLVTELVDLESQLQPNGLDLTLRKISRFDGPGVIGTGTDQRILPDLIDLPFDDDGWVMLGPGAHHIQYNEVVHLPPNLMALGRPRSSLARSGVSIHTAVWDAGYSGRSTSLLVVHTAAGFRVRRDARVMQLVFFSLTAATTSGYAGRYQHENLG